MGAAAGPGLEGAVDAAHGEAGDVQEVDGAQHTEVWLPVSLPLEAHQLLHGGLVQDLASLRWGNRAISSEGLTSLPSCAQT